MQILNQDCTTCTVHNKKNLERLGIEMNDYNFLVALAGNPNTGKSTVFNYMTGLHQHTGNWPGKTVSRAEGAFIFNGNKYKLIDLPGTYSLLSTSSDEEIARDFILFGKPDVTVIVVDATRLERNLNLTLQILEITERVVVCINLADEARRHGISVDPKYLSRRLGVPVVLASARQGEGMQDLLTAVEGVAKGEIACKPYRITSLPAEIRNAIEHLSTQIETAFPGLPNTRWIALRLLEGDQRMIEAVQTGELSGLAEALIPQHTVA